MSELLQTEGAASADRPGPDPGKPVKTQFSILEVFFIFFFFIFMDTSSRYKIQKGKKKKLRLSYSTVSTEYFKNTAIREKCDFSAFRYFRHFCIGAVVLGIPGV